APVGGVDLHAISPIAAEHTRCGTVVDQIANKIRKERHGGVAAERSDLIVEIRSDFPLQSEYAEIVLLKLVLIDAGRGIHRNGRERENLLLIRIRWNLEMVC